MAVKADFTGEMERCALTVDGILCEAAESGDGDEERGEFRVIDKLEM